MVSSFYMAVCVKLYVMCIWYTFKYSCSEINRIITVQMHNGTVKLIKILNEIEHHREPQSNFASKDTSLQLC